METMYDDYYMLGTLPIYYWNMDCYNFTACEWGFHQLCAELSAFKKLIK